MFSPVRSMQRILKIAAISGSGLLVAALAGGATGCSTLQGAQSGVNTANSTVSGTKQTADTTKQVGTDIKGGVDGLLGNKKDPVTGKDLPEDEDGKRIQAKHTPSNTPINDELSLVKNDVMDWKQFDLSKVKKNTWVKFLLNWDERETEINLDVFNQIGALVVQSPGRSGTAQKEVLLRVERPGVYYARLAVLAGYPKNESVYTVVLDLGGPFSAPKNERGKDKDKDKDGAGAAPAGAGGAPAGPAPGGPPMAGAPGGYPPQGAFPGAGGGYPPQGAFPGAGGGYPPPGAFPGAGGVPPGPAPAPTPAPAPKSEGGDVPANAVVGKVVNSFRESDGKLVLYLNKGSKDKLRVGMSGDILEGSDGGTKLSGANFTITKVISDGQAVASSSYAKSLGKNNRFMVAKSK